jgi:hypothetical protein
MSEKINPRKANRLPAAWTLALDALLTPLRGRKPHILLACMPKSGSTFFAAALAECPGFRNISLVPAYDRREQELCPIMLSRYNGDSYVGQLHVRHNAWTQVLIEKYNLTPVVLVRNLADAVVSFRDHMRNESTVGPMAYVTEEHLKLDDAGLEDALVRLAMPWYLHFYASWRAAPNALFVNYRDVTAEPAAAMAEVLKRAGAQVSGAEIAQAVERARAKRNRFNVGVSGRGGKLSPAAAQGLLALLDLYPSLAADPLFVETRATLSGTPAEARKTTA